VQDRVNTVVRFHDVARLQELERCIFSLVGQTYRPLNIILALQRFTVEQVDLVKNTIAPIISGDGAASLSITNYDRPLPVDARSDLLNLGISQASGGYLGFLDYDDVLYPEAYQLLIAQMKNTSAAIAFASVRVMRLSVYEQFLYTEGKAKPPFKGSNLLDLFRGNFCPLHSYLLDLRKIPADTLQFNTSLTVEEDYDMLLRICAQHRSDFTLVGTYIGDYHYKTDGSNTVPTEGGLSGEALNQYMDVRATIEETRRTTTVSASVQRALGLPASVSPVTIRDVIKQFSSGWLSRLMRTPVSAATFNAN
jgi:hypothetical protein